MSQKTVDDASSWWYYFIRTDETHVKCNSCEWERVYDSKKGTNSLKCHLEKKHQDKFKEKEEAEKKKRDAENKRKTAREQQPNLFKHGFSSSCQTEQQSSRKRQHSPIRNFPIFIHYIDELFEPKFYILEARPVHGRHTAENYVEILNDSLELFGIEQHKIHLFMRDAQSTMQATTRGVDSFDCLAHKIQLSVNDGLRTIDGFRTIRESAKKNNAKDKKKSNLQGPAQGITKIQRNSAANDVEVRWNSTYLMLKSLLENRRVLSISSQEDNLPKFTEIEWEMISAIVEVLEPVMKGRTNNNIFCFQMYLATLEIENRRCSISSCVPIVTTIIRHLECNANRPQIQLNEFRKAISDGLKFRMAKAGWEQWCCTNSALPGCLGVAIMIDPRYKMKFFEAFSHNSHRSLLEHTAAEFATLSPNGNQSSDHLESPIRLGGIFALMEAQECH
ncbi:hypothetical protein niasHT_013102 [Heterodera trifolii]|uniref:BED-type domain-containing protein n=1 Tax=Heterodera trifolii TaxID=157864 RepID=A0ABD2L9Y2_9BILA